MGFIFVTFASWRIYSLALARPYRLAVRTPPFHGGSTGSIPVRVANLDFSPRSFSAALVPPGVHDEENEDDKPQEQKHERARLAFPKLLKTLGDLSEIHAGPNLHQL